MSLESARSYHAPRRHMQAAQTRAAVIDAAIALFGEFGWVNTSMRRVAKTAGVSMETVYSGFGSKGDLLAAVMDVAVVGDDLPIPLAQRDIALRLSHGTREERVAKAVSMSVSISRRTCELVQTLTQASATDTVLAGRLTALDQQRRGETAGYFEEVASRAPTDLELDEVWLLTSAEVFHLLVHRLGWTPEQHEQWLSVRILELVSQKPQNTPDQGRKARRKA